MVCQCSDSSGSSLHPLYTFPDTNQNIGSCKAEWKANPSQESVESEVRVQSVISLWLPLPCIKGNERLISTAPARGIALSNKGFLSLLYLELLCVFDGKLQI